MKKYEIAELEIVRFAQTDVILASTYEAGAGGAEVSGGGAELE